MSMSIPSENILITEAELYVLSVIYGLDRLSGSFSQENIRPDEKDLPYILNSLANKALIVSNGTTLSVTENTARLLECYKKPHSVVFWHFDEIYLPDIFCICCHDELLCAERQLNQSRGIKLFLTNPSGLYNYLAEEGFLDAVPVSASETASPDEREYEEITRNIVSIERHSFSQKTETWSVFYTPHGCFMGKPDNSIVYASRDILAEAIYYILTPNGV